MGSLSRYVKCLLLTIFVLVPSNSSLTLNNHALHLPGLRDSNATSALTSRLTSNGTSSNASVPITSDDEWTNLTAHPKAGKVSCSRLGGISLNFDSCDNAWSKISGDPTEILFRSRGRGRAQEGDPRSVKIFYNEKGVFQNSEKSQKASSFSNGVFGILTLYLSGT